MAGTAFRFVHAADLHLDSPLRGLSRTAPWLQPVLQQASLDAFDRLVDLAVEASAAFVVWAGDVFDHTAPSLRAQLKLADGIARLGDQGIPVFWAHGNHDPADALSLDISWPDNLTRFPAGRVGHAGVRDPRHPGRTLCEVYGVSYPESRVTAGYAEQFFRDDEAPWAVAVLHANVGGQPGHDNYAPARLSDLTARPFDYWALGHIHHRAVLSEAPWVVYPGNLQGRHPREDGPKGAVVVHVDEAGAARTAFHPLAPVVWRTVAVDVFGEAHADRLEDRVAQALADGRADAGAAGSLVRVELTGRSVLARLGPEDWLAMADRLSDTDARPGFVFVESIVPRIARPLAPDPSDGLLARALAEVDRLDLPPEWGRLWPRGGRGPASGTESREQRDAAAAVRERVKDRLRDVLGEEESGEGEA